MDVKTMVSMLLTRPNAPKPKFMLSGVQPGMGFWFAIRYWIPEYSSAVMISFAGVFPVYVWPCPWSLAVWYVVKSCDEESQLKHVSGGTSGFLCPGPLLFP